MKRLRTLLVPLLLLAGVATAWAQSLQQRIDAASHTARSDTQSTQSNFCSGLRNPGFYWEIGDANGPYTTVAQGTIVSDPPNDHDASRATPMKIASGSKWVYAAYVAQRWGATSLTPRDWQFLTMSSGYHSLETDDQSKCSGPGGSLTVDGCLALCAADGTCNDHNSNDSGEFYYNGGHFEAQSGSLNLFTPISIFHANRLGDDDKVGLGKELDRYLAPASDSHWITFDWPVLAEGIDTEPGQYIDDFLRRILSQQLQEYSILGQNAVCTNTNGEVCPSALFEPPELCLSGESWHYSAGHWIEDDPRVAGDPPPVPAIPDDGAYSSPGGLGFYPWLWVPRPPWNVFNWNTSIYGVVARNGAADFPSRSSNDCRPARTEADVVSWDSIMCGRAIRRAFLTGMVEPPQ